MIVFRGQPKDNDDEFENGIIAENPNVSHSVIRMRKHIDHDGVSGGDPYISFTEKISIAAMKYAYGEHYSKSTGYKLNTPEGKKRGVVLLVDLDPQRAEEPLIDQVASNGKVSYYTADNIPCLKGYAKADREVIVHGSVPKDLVYEVHPFLVDVLIALDEFKSPAKPQASKMYDFIIEKIKSGEYSVDAINSKLEAMEMNQMESMFVEEYYKNRLNMEATFDKIIKPTSEFSTRNKLLAGNALRVQVMKDLFQYFYTNEKEFRNLDSNGDFFRFVYDFSLPIEEDVRTTAKMASDLDNSTHKYFKNLAIPGITEDKDVIIPFGMRFMYDDAGNVVGITAINRSIKKHDKGTRPQLLSNLGEREIVKAKTMENSKYTGIDLENNPTARFQREIEINSSKKVGRQNPQKESEYWFFDEDGYCLVCKKYGSKYRIVDFLRDSDGERTKYDPLGYDTNGYDKDGYDNTGFDRNALDRASCKKSGIPGELTFIMAKTLEPNDIDAIIRQAMEKHSGVEDKEKISSESPLQRMVEKVVVSTLTAAHESTTYGPNKKYVTVNQYDEQIYYKNLLEAFFDRKMKYSDTIDENSKLALDNLVKSILRLAPEYGIDIKDAFSQEMEKRIASTKKVLEEANATLETAKESLKRNGVDSKQITKQTAKERKAVKTAKTKVDFTDERLRLGRDKFKEKYEDFDEK